jgi:phage terminase large subunit GpA-like protein
MYSCIYKIEPNCLEQGQDTEDTLEVLEQRQSEIISNLIQLKNQAWQLDRVYTTKANQIKEAKLQATEKEEQNVRTNFPPSFFFFCHTCR